MNNKTISDIFKRLVVMALAFVMVFGTVIPMTTQKERKAASTQSLTEARSHTDPAPAATVIQESAISVMIWEPDIPTASSRTSRPHRQEAQP